MSKSETELSDKELFVEYHKMIGRNIFKATKLTITYLAFLIKQAVMLVVDWTRSREKEVDDRNERENRKNHY